jgi:hypothetical protein
MHISYIIFSFLDLLFVNFIFISVLFKKCDDTT